MKRKRNRAGVLYLFTSIILVAAVGLSFGLNVLAPQQQEDAPERLGDLVLVSTVRDAEARDQVNRLHGLNIDLVSALVAVYNDSSPYRGSSQATIWVGQAENAEAALALTRRMVERIREGGSAFGNLQRLNIDGQEVFQVSGPGGEHFFYNSGKQSEAVVWVTVEADDSLAIIKEAVKIF